MVLLYPTSATTASPDAGLACSTSATMDSLGAGMAFPTSATMDLA